MVGVGLLPKTRSRSRTGCLTCRRRKKKCDEELYPTCLNCKKKLLGCEWPEIKHELNKKLKQVRYIQNNPTSLATPNITETISNGTINLVAESYKTLASNALGSKELQDYTLVAKDIQLLYMESGEEDSSPNIPFNVSELESPQKEHFSESSIIRRSIDLGRPNNLDTETEVLRRQNGYFLERIALQQDCVDSEEEIPPESLLNSITTTSFTSHTPSISHFIDANSTSSETDSRITLQKSLTSENTDKFNSINYEDFIS